MSFLRKFFSKKVDEDYETVLSNLATEIQTRQTKLSEIRLRERRSSLWATLYTLAAWVLYVGLWFQKWLPWDDPVGIIPVVIGPIVILFTRRIVQVWYNRKGNAEEKTLSELQKKRRGIVEDIKKKTNYYSTRNLIERYDESAPVATPSRPTRPAQSISQPRPVPLSNRAPVQQQPASISSGPRPQQQQQQQQPTPISAVPSHLYASPNAYPSTPPRKQWYDKLADAILGDDDHAPSSAATRYALICDKCFTHNGLVKESAWEDTQFRCMKCQHLNPSSRSKKANVGRESLSPAPSCSSISPSRSDPDTSIDSAPSPLRKRKAAGRRSGRGKEEDEEEDRSMMEVDS